MFKIRKSETTLEEHLKNKGPVKIQHYVPDGFTTYTANTPDDEDPLEVGEVVLASVEGGPKKAMVFIGNFPLFFDVGFNPSDNSAQVEPLFGKVFYDANAEEVHNEMHMEWELPDPVPAE